MKNKRQNCRAKFCVMFLIKHYVYFTGVQIRCKINTKSKSVRAVAQNFNLQSLLEGCRVPWNERTASFSRLAVDQLKSSVSQLGGLKFFTPEFGWARATRGNSQAVQLAYWRSCIGKLEGSNKTTMTSTNMFQGLDTASKPSSRWTILSRVAQLFMKKIAYIVLLSSVVVGRPAIKLSQCRITLYDRSYSKLFAYHLSAIAFQYDASTRDLCGRLSRGSLVWVVLR